MTGPYKTREPIPTGGPLTYRPELGVSFVLAEDYRMQNVKEIGIDRNVDKELS
jgi:hypothetical protein